MVKMVKASFQHKEHPRLNRWNGLNLFGISGVPLPQFRWIPTFDGFKIDVHFPAGRSWFNG
jgi:hypothetical protein